MIHQSANGQLAIREGNWKLVLGNGSGGREKPRGKPLERPYQLFNLASDPEEKSDQIEDQSKIEKELIAKFEKIAHGDHQAKSK